MIPAFMGGLACGTFIFFLGFVVGRKTSYQDKGMKAPPIVQMPRIEDLFKPKKKEPVAHNPLAEVDMTRRS